MKTKKKKEKKYPLTIYHSLVVVCGLCSLMEGDSRLLLPPGAKVFSLSFFTSFQFIIQFFLASQFSLLSN